MVTTATQLLVPGTITRARPRVAPVLGQPEEAAGGGGDTFPFGRTREISIICSRQQRVSTQASLGIEKWKGIYLPIYLFI